MTSNNSTQPLLQGQTGDTKLPLPRPRAPMPLDIPVLNAIKGKRVILASASPRRRQLFAQACLVSSYFEYFVNK